jgi:hypothetical protein
VSGGKQNSVQHRRAASLEGAVAGNLANADAREVRATIRNELPTRDGDAGGAQQSSTEVQAGGQG